MDPIKARGKCIGKVALKVQSSTLWTCGSAGYLWPRSNLGVISHVRKRHLPVSRVSHVFDLVCHEQGPILKPTARGRPRGLKSGGVFSPRNRCVSRAAGQLGRVVWRGFSGVKPLEFVVKEMDSSCRQLPFHTNRKQVFGISRPFSVRLTRVSLSSCIPPGWLSLANPLLGHSTWNLGRSLLQHDFHAPLSLSELPLVHSDPHRLEFFIKTINIHL